MLTLARARLLAVCAPVFWSLTGIVVRLMEDADQWQVNVYRSGSLAVFMVCYLLARYRGKFCQLFREAGIKAILGGFCVGLAMFCNIIAIAHTTVANATGELATSADIWPAGIAATGATRISGFGGHTSLANTSLFVHVWESEGNLADLKNWQWSHNSSGTLRLRAVNDASRYLCVDRIFTSSGGNCVAMGGVFLGQNVFLERVDLAARETIKVTTQVFRLKTEGYHA